MKKARFQHYKQRISQQYQRIENYFTNGSFGVKFYPFLMYPCVRHSQSLFVKLLAVLSVFIGIYFFVAELIAILFSQDSLANYVDHTLFELSRPVGSIIDGQTITLSPLSYSVRASFLVQGYTFSIVYLFAVMQITQGVRLIAGLLAISFSICMIMIFSAQGGTFTEGGLQNLGVSITFLLGNLTVIFTGLTVNATKLYAFKRFCLILGTIGLSAILFTFFEPTAYLPVLERVSLYAILIWEIAVGFTILKQVK